MSQGISDLNDAERAWLARNEAKLRAFARSLGATEDAWRPLDPPALDRTWAAWLAVHVRGAEDQAQILNAFGVALGQYLAERFGFVWKVVQEEDDADFALLGQPGDILIFPPMLVAKRFAAGETEFFVRVVDEAEELITAARLP